MAECNVQTLLKAGKCFSRSCLSDDSQRVIRLQLLCEILAASGDGGVTSIIAGDGISVDQATGDVTVSATGLPVTNVFFKELTSPATWAKSDFTNNAFKDFTSYFAPFGLDATAESQIAAALTAGKQIRFFGFGTINVTLGSAQGGAYEMFHFGFNPFATIGGSESFLPRIQSYCTETDTQYSIRFSFDTTTDPTFGTNGGAADRTVVATCEPLSTGVPASIYTRNFLYGPPSPATGKIFAYFSDRLGDITVFNMVLNGCGIQIIG